MRHAEFERHSDERSYIFFGLFHLIFDLLIIFMLMINIVKIILINTSENYLLNVFSVRNVFLTN